MTGGPVAVGSLGNAVYAHCTRVSRIPQGNQQCAKRTDASMSFRVLPAGMTAVLALSGVARG